MSMIEEAKRRNLESAEMADKARAFDELVQRQKDVSIFTQGQTMGQDEGRRMGQQEGLAAMLNELAKPTRATNMYNQSYYNWDYQN